MMAESSLLSEGMKVRTIPTPREISTSCGLSIKTEIENYQRIFDLDLLVEKYWRLVEDSKGRRAEVIE